VILVAPSALEEPVSGARVATCGDEHVDDLAELVDRPVDVAPRAGRPDVGLVHEPAVADGVSAGPGRLGQQRREPLDPPVDRSVIDLNAPLGEQLLDVVVGQPEVEVPADGDDDDVGREPEASEDGPRDRGRGEGGGLSCSQCRSWWCGCHGALRTLPGRRSVSSSG
jgi:hypothetical protein